MKWSAGEPSLNATTVGSDVICMITRFRLVKEWHTPVKDIRDTVVQALSVFQYRR